MVAGWGSTKGVCGMLTLMRLRNAKEEVIEGLAKKRMDARR